MRKSIFSAFILLVIVSGLLVSANAEIPRLINYQGRLTDSSGTPLNGPYNITFRIYDAESAGNLLWQGTYSGVSITKGTFNIMLGDVSDSGFNFAALTFDKPYWLEIKVGTDDPMQPRQRITSAGYAIMAEKAQEVASLPSGMIVLWSGKISDIPAGWALCNGSNGTPDLRDKFIVGANQDSGGVVKTNVRGSLEQAGGEAKHTLTIAEMPAHIHSESGHAGWGGRGGDDGAGCMITTQTGTTGDGQAHENCPPFYALAYIMKL